MTDLNKKVLVAAFSALLVSGVCCDFFGAGYCANSAALSKNLPAKKTVQRNVQKGSQALTVPQPHAIINASSLAIVQNPSKYLNKTVKMQATFDKFSTLGLDYSKARRESTKYIGILIQRDDIIDHNIPLSEMKLFMDKDMAQKHIDLDTGDKIELVAHVFSTALGDPWLDIESLKVIKKAKKDEAKS